MLKKISNIVSGVAIAGGFILGIGTCGSADLNLITSGTLMVRIGIAVALVIGGCIGLSVGEPIYIDWD